MRIIFVLSTFVLFLFACKQQDGPSPTGLMDNSPAIIYYADSSIYSMDANGNGKSRVTFIDKMGSSPIAYSTLTQKVLFTSNQGNPFDKGELFSMNLNGTDLIQITNNNLSELEFSFSNDGKSVAYYAMDFGIQTGSLRIANSDGSNDHEVVFPKSIANYQAAPLSWSPNDSVIAFIGIVSDTNSVRKDGIFSINLNSGELITILRDSLDPINIQFSPDGSKIAFIGFDDSRGHYNVFTMESGGNNIQKITNLSRSSGSNVLTRYVSWSSNGDNLAFTTNVDMPASETIISGKYYEIYKVDSDGTNLTRLTNDSIFETSPIWIN